MKQLMPVDNAGEAIVSAFLSAPPVPHIAKALWGLRTLGDQVTINPLNAAVVAIFGNPWAAIWISLGILIWCALIVVRNRQRFHVPVTKALNDRLAALAPIEEADGTDAAQQAFVDHFEKINAEMSAGGVRSQELQLAWKEFRETILDETETPMRATARSDGYFLHLGDDTRILAWWANIFVAVGLTFTFLGIVAALTATVTALQSGQGAGGMTEALIRLLEITSVKFWTSIAGVVASIVLRFVDRRWHASTQGKLEKIVELLDLGTLFSPAQRIAALQLHEAREQTSALKTFSHDLALAIGDNLERQMGPMIGALGGIQASIDDFKSGSFNEIGREFGEALSRQAGGEMQALAGALSTMTDRLAGVNDRLEGSSQAASDQIASAARDFLAASDSIGRAFATLNERIEGMADRLVEQSEAASTRAAAHVAEERAAYQAIADDQRGTMRAMGEEVRAASVAATGDLVAAVREAVRNATEESGAGVRAALANFTDASAGIRESFDQVRGQIADMGTSLRESAAGAAERNANVLERAAAALEQGTVRAASGMTQAVDAAISKAAEESTRVMTQAFAAFGERFEAASGGLVTTLRTTAGRMEELAGSIERSVRASDDHANRLTQVGMDTQGVAATLTRAANDMQIAANPIRLASETIGNATVRTGEALDAHAKAAETHRQAIGTISDRLGETADSATRAWSDYRERFEGVDRALAATLEQIKSASAEHAAHLNEQVGRIDLALGNAVDRLSAALEPLNELAGQIDDLIGRMPKAS